jgi:membrane associated rhomboid family serine protease
MQEHEAMSPSTPAAVFKCPVILMTAAAAVAVTAWWHLGGYDIEPFTMDDTVFHGQPWRLLTSTFPHVDLFHLVFNLYWLWVLGSQCERTFGSMRTAGMLLLFAVCSSAAEWSLSVGGVGLSGVGYGIFGFLWVLSRRHPKLRGAVDQRTVILFVGWFFLCIALTAAKKWNVGNVAHGAGIVAGVLLGEAVDHIQTKRMIFISAVAAFALVTVCAAWFGRPWLNPRDAAHDLGRLGNQAMERKEYKEAEGFYRRAVLLNDKEDWLWFNLGVACQHQSQYAEAMAAYGKAAALEPSNAEYRKAFTNVKDYVEPPVAPAD